MLTKQEQEEEWKKECQETKRIVFEQGKVNNMDNVLKFPVFSIYTEEILSKQKNTAIIMGDMNNVQSLNNINGNEKTDEMIKALIQKIRGVLENNKISCIIGKLGDEIYITVAEIEDEKLKKLINELNEVQVEGENVDLTIGFGTARNKGEIEKTLKDAEEQMEKAKISRKKSGIEEKRVV